MDGAKGCVGKEGEGCGLGWGGGMGTGRGGGGAEGRMKELREMQFVGCKHACMTKKDALNGIHISARINRKSPCIDGASVFLVPFPGS